MTSKGIFYLVFALFTFAVQDALVKYITEEYEVIQILTWRIIFVVGILAVISYFKIGWRFLKTPNWKFMLLRGFFAFAAFTNYYFALSYIPLADAATVYMTAPLFVTALSVPLLGEHVGVRRWLAVIVGFAAVVFMLNPGSELFRLISLLPLLSALFYSIIPILTRNFKPNEHTLTITFYTASSYAVLCSLLSIAIHIWPASPQNAGIWGFVAQPWAALDFTTWMLVALSSVLFAVGILSITTAYRSAEVSVHALG